MFVLPQIYVEILIFNMIVIEDGAFENWLEQENEPW